MICQNCTHRRRYCRLPAISADCLSHVGDRWADVKDRMRMQIPKPLEQPADSAQDEQRDWKGWGVLTILRCLRLYSDLFRSCFMATKMRTLSPIFLMPISCRIF